MEKCYHHNVGESGWLQMTEAGFMECHFIVFVVDYLRKSKTLIVKILQASTMNISLCCITMDIVPKEP